MIPNHSTYWIRTSTSPSRHVAALVSNFRAAVVQRDGRKPLRLPGLRPLPRSIWCWRTCQINSESTASMALPKSPPTFFEVLPANMMEWISGVMQWQRIVSGLHCFNSCLKGQVKLSGTQNPALTHNRNMTPV